MPELSRLFTGRYSSSFPCHTLAFHEFCVPEQKPIAALQVDNINKDDYFAKNAEFAAWLREEKGKFFNQMDSDETRALFGRV